MSTLNIIEEVEAAVLAAFKSAGLDAREFDISAEPSLLPSSGVNIALWDAPISPVSMNTWKIDAVFYLTIVIRNVKGVKDRRTDIYPVILAALAIIAGKKLTLETAGETHAVRPRRMRRVLNDSERIAFTVELVVPIFYTVDDEDSALSYLEQVVSSYMIKPDDDTADSQSTINLT